MGLIDWLKRIQEGITSGKYPATKDRPQPELADTFVAAPDELASLIRGVGGDPARCVRWFETERGPVWRFAVPGKAAVATWRTLRAAVEKSGHWPLILGPNEAIEHQNGHLQYNESPGVAAILARATGETVERWRRGRHLDDESDPEFARPHDKWPASVERPDEFSVPLKTFSRKPHESVWLGLLPTRDSCEVAALFNFGEWNDVPEAAVHVAIHRDWRERFGAEIACLTGDIIEMQVARPPMTREAAQALAEEQYDYCPDIVDQGVGSIEALAARLLNGRIWYFWWD